MSAPYDDFPEDEFNSEMVRKLRSLLLSNAGAQSVTVDGQSVAYADLVARLKEFELRLKAQNGGRPIAFQVDLGGF